MRVGVWSASFHLSNTKSCRHVKKIWKITHIFYGFISNEVSTWMLHLSLNCYCLCTVVPVRQFVLPQCADLQRRQAVKYSWCSVDIITECPQTRGLWSHYSIKYVLKQGQFPFNLLRRVDLPLTPQLSQFVQHWLCTRAAQNILHCKSPALGHIFPFTLSPDGKSIHLLTAIHVKNLFVRQGNVQ